MEKEFDIYECKECGVEAKMMPKPNAPDKGLIYCPACETGTIHVFVRTEGLRQLEERP